MLPNQNALTVVPGSLAAVAAENGGLVAPPIAVVLLDTSYSMEHVDAVGENGQLISRHAAATAQLTKLQAAMPGQIALLCFSSEVEMVPGGVPLEPHGYTNLAGALREARNADNGTMKFVVISDGGPDSETDAMNEAMLFSVPIDCVYVGKDRRGETFMRHLAMSTGGQFTSDTGEMRLLADTVQRFLLAAPIEV
jgi:hypothetical protein